MSALSAAFAAVRALVAQEYPGRVPVALCITLDGGHKVRLPVPLAGGDAPAAPRPAGESAALSEMERDVLQAAAEAAEPLTGQELADGAGYPFDSAMRACLAGLRRRALLGGGQGQRGYSPTDAGRQALAGR